MSALWYALWFMVAVSLLVTVHEFGHYWVARRLGFKVLRFSIGFGQPLLARRFGPDQTEYVLAAIPLGGYVKLLDEREGPVAQGELGRAFTRRPAWQRIAVLLAGPTFNIVFAILLLWGILWARGITDIRPVIGDVARGSVAAAAGVRAGDTVRRLDGAPVGGLRDLSFGLLDAMSSRGSVVLTLQGRDGSTRQARLSVPDPTQRRRLTEPAELFRGLGLQIGPPVAPVVGQVLPDGPAARAGLQAGDRFVAVDGVPVSDFRQLVDLISTRPGETIAITYARGGTEHTVHVTVASEEAAGHRIGRIRVLPQAGAPLPPEMLTHTELGVPAALGRACGDAWNMTELQARLFWRMLLGQVSIKNLSGPLAIAEYAGQSAHAGVASFIDFLVLISLSLGFLNLLPIPILDGGQVVFQLVEWLKGSPLSEKAQAFGQQVGIALLILLMSVALFNDIARQFG